MAHVIVLDSVSEDIFVCGSCKSVYNSLELFLDHKKACLQVQHTAVVNENSHNIISVLDVPDTPLPSKETVVDNSAINPRIPCTLCGNLFKKKKSLLAHMKSHYSKPFQCRVCGRCFIQNSHLKRHILSHKVWPESLTETTPKSTDVELLSYACPYCQILFSDYNQYRLHLKIHISMKKFKCVQSNCSSFHDTIEDLLNHVSLVHLSPVYVCFICSDTFDSLESIASHQLTHKSLKTTMKSYKCSQCDATFKKVDKLSLHMLTENHKKVCIHCGRIFASDKRLRLHLQIHRNKKPFQCNVCRETFHMKKYLTAHMLRHGTREFKCTLCKYMSKRSDLLQRHMRCHQTSKMYKCPYNDVCQREFHRKDKLKQHIQTHKKHVQVKENENTKNNSIEQ